MYLLTDGLTALVFFDFLSSSNSTLKGMYVWCYVSPQEQRNLAEHTYRYGRTHRHGPAFRAMSSYYFLAGVCDWGTRGQESHFCEGSGPHWSFLCPKPPPCITPTCTLSPAFLSSPTELPPARLPQACPPRKSSHSSKAWDEPLQWPGRPEAEGDV